MNDPIISNGLLLEMNTFNANLHIIWIENMISKQIL